MRQYYLMVLLFRYCVFRRAGWRFIVDWRVIACSDVNRALLGYLSGILHRRGKDYLCVYSGAILSSHILKA